MRPGRALAASVLATLMTTTATAQRRATTPPPSAPPVAQPTDARQQAEARFQRGIELVEREQWSLALEEFLRANELYPSLILRFNIGYCQRGLGLFVQALETLRAFISEATSGVAVSRRAEAEGYVRELESRIAHIEVRLFEDDRGHASVSVDGRPLRVDATGVARVAVNPGRRTVSVSREGFRPFFQDRDMGPGERAVVQPTLRAMPATVSITADVRGARVRMLANGARRPWDLGRVPVERAVDPGRYRVEIMAPGHHVYRATLNLRAGGEGRIAADLVRDTGGPVTSRWWFWTAIGVAAVGAGVASYFVISREEVVPRPASGGTTGWVVEVP